VAYVTIDVRHDESIAWMTLARPQAGNALDGHAVAELLHAIGHAVDDAAIRVLAINASGPQFSVAGDLCTPMRLGAVSEHPAIDGSVLFDVLRDCPKPVVAVVQGDAHSAGLGLIAAVDLCIASAQARFWLPELRGGLWPGLPMAALARVIGPRRTLELALLPDSFDVHFAADLGLVQKIVAAEQVEIEAFVFLRALVQRNPSAFRLGLPAFRRGLDEDLPAALARARDAIEKLLSTEDVREAIAAYQDGRKPWWHDR